MFTAVRQNMDAVKIIIHLKELQITVERSVITQSLTNKYALRLTKFTRGRSMMNGQTKYQRLSF